MKMKTIKKAAIVTVCRDMELRGSVMEPFNQIQSRLCTKGGATHFTRSPGGALCYHGSAPMRKVFSFLLFLSVAQALCADPAPMPAPAAASTSTVIAIPLPE